METWPRLIDDHPPITLVHKTRWEDFVVEEVPAYEPEGRGDHTFFEIEKAGLATHRAVSDIAGALGVPPRDIGVAGLKDAHSIARQWLSIEHVDPARVLALQIPRITVLRAERHPRKLRRGHHRGNRFSLKLRAPGLQHDAGGAAIGGGAGPDADAGSGAEASAQAPLDRHLPAIRAALEVLRERGVPNYYGEQRFGTRGDTWQVGRALARDAAGEAAALIAGRPSQADAGDVLRARELFEDGRYAEAARAWPRGFRQCVRLAEAMERTGGDARRAIPVVGKRMLRFYASAYQSWLFNHVLARRLEGIDRLMNGDLAWKHGNEALFLVEDAAAEEDRARAFEISATGPLVGKRMRQPEGDAATLEAEVLGEAGLEPAELDSRAMRPLAGSRRPLRFPLRDVAHATGDDDLGPFIRLEFTLPPGTYATEVLREITGHDTSG